MKIKTLKLILSRNASNYFGDCTLCVKEVNTHFPETKNKETITVEFYNEPVDGSTLIDVNRMDSELPEVIFGNLVLMVFRSFYSQVSLLKNVNDKLYVKII